MVISGEASRLTAEPPAVTVSVVVVRGVYLVSSIEVCTLVEKVEIVVLDNVRILFTCC